jgi:L-rhamnose isomerase/sugar isomerase
MTDRERFDAAAEAVRKQEIEIPSWGFGLSGTRFAKHPIPGQAWTLEQRIQDAATVQRYTGAPLRVSLHLPWDVPESWATLGASLREAGLSPGTVNPNLFEDPDYRLGSITNADAGIRRKAVEHILDGIAATKELGTTDMWVWLPDGTNAPGQAEFRQRNRWLSDALAEVYGALEPDQRLLIEYKPFEPAFYHTDMADWGQALRICQLLGERAQVAVDTGHHPHGVNIEHIAAILLEDRRLGSFDLNNRKYADDDLMVGSTNPFELFLVFVEVVSGIRDPRPEISRAASAVLHKIDIAFNVEDKMAAMIRSVVATQSAFAKAWLVDYDALAAARTAGDVVGAHCVLQDAFETDVRGLLASVRRAAGAPEDPVADYLEGDERRSRAGRQRPDPGAEIMTVGRPV